MLLIGLLKKVVVVNSLSELNIWFDYVNFLLKQLNHYQVNLFFQISMTAQKALAWMVVNVWMKLIHIDVYVNLDVRGIAAKVFINLVPRDALSLPACTCAAKRPCLRLELLCARILFIGSTQVQKSYILLIKSWRKRCLLAMFLLVAIFLILIASMHISTLFK